MAITISALDVYYFRQELAAQLLTAKVEQVYQHDAASITMRFYKAGSGKIDLFISPPKGLYLTTKKPAASPDQYGFCGIMRKYLPNMILDSIEQIGFSRTLKFNFSFKETHYSLVVELYDKGNIILIDASADPAHAQKILAPLQTQRWQHRIIAADEIYTPDITQFPYELSEQKVTDLANAGAAESMTASKFATTKFNLGGTYGALLCKLANISPSIVISKDEAILLHKHTKDLFTQQLAPCVRKETGKETPADTVTGIVTGIFPFRHEALGETQPVPSLSAAYEQSLMLHDKPVDNPQLRAATAAQKKFQNILDAQKSSIAQLNEEVIHNQHIGELMYANHARFEQLLTSIKSAVDKKDKTALAQLGVKKHDPIHKTVVITMDEEAPQ